MLESKNMRKEKKINHIQTIMIYMHLYKIMCGLTKAHTCIVQPQEKNNDHYKGKFCTYLSFPNMGESPIITDAKADLTCWLGSITKSYGKTNNVDNKHYTMYQTVLCFTKGRTQ